MSYLCCKHLKDHIFVLTISQGTFHIHLSRNECQYFDMEKFENTSIYENHRTGLVLSCHKCARYRTSHFFPSLCSCSIKDFYNSNYDIKRCDCCGFKFVDVSKSRNCIYYINLFGSQICEECVYDCCPNLYPS